MENGSRKVGLRMAAGVLVAIIIIVAVFASGVTLPGFENNPGLGSEQGRLNIFLKDAPVEANALWINMTALEIHNASDGKWITINIEDAVELSTPPEGPERDYLEFDLLKYQGTEQLELAEANVYTGTYNKIRLTVTGAEAWFWDKEDLDLIYNEDGYPIEEGSEEISDDVTIRPLRVPPNRIDVIIDFTITPDVEVTVTIDMQPDLIAISNSDNLRPVMKATVDYAAEG